MELDIIKLHTTWNDAAGGINANFAKLLQAITLLEGKESGLDENQLEEYLKANGYTTEDWVLAKNYLQSIDASMIVEALGYEPTKKEDFDAAKRENATTNSQQDERLAALEGLWTIEDGNLVTTMPVMVKNNVIATGEVSAGGAGEVGEDGEGETTGEYKMYHHKQSEPSAEWTIVHGLGKFPNVKIIDSLRQLCYGDVIYEDTNTVLVKFTAAESGDAYLD